MNRKVHEFYQETVQDKFTFLISDYGFTGPYEDFNKKTGFLTVQYVGENLAVQFILDQREEFITCKIATVTNGVVTDKYAINDKGVLVRDYLTALLWRDQIPDGQFTHVKDMSLEEKIPVKLDDFSRIIREHGQIILEDNPEIFKLEGNT